MSISALLSQVTGQATGSAAGQSGALPTAGSSIPSDGSVGLFDGVIKKALVGAGIGAGVSFFLPFGPLVGGALGALAGAGFGIFSNFRKMNAMQNQNATTLSALGVQPGSQEEAAQLLAGYVPKTGGAGQTGQTGQTGQAGTDQLTAAQIAELQKMGLDVPTGAKLDPKQEAEIVAMEKQLEAFQTGQAPVLQWPTQGGGGKTTEGANAGPVQQSTPKQTTTPLPTQAPKAPTQTSGDKGGVVQQKGGETDATQDAKQIDLDRRARHRRHMRELRERWENASAEERTAILAHIRACVEAWRAAHGATQQTPVKGGDTPVQQVPTDKGGDVTTPPVQTPPTQTPPVQTPPTQTPDDAPPVTQEPPKVDGTPDTPRDIPVQQTEDPSEPPKVTTTPDGTPATDDKGGATQQTPVTPTQTDSTDDKDDAPTQTVHQVTQKVA